MIRFEHPDLLYALALLPIVIGIFIISSYARSRRLRRFGDPSLVARLTPELSKGRVRFKFILFLISLTLLILGMANPQIGSRLEQIERKGIDIIIALDVSNSMLAEDIRPNRIERSKQSIFRLIDRMSNDRIGIVVFAGKAYTQLPITTDYAAAKLFLNTISTEIIPTQGTAIGDAINLSLTAFSEGPQGKAVIIITDGENHEDDAIGAATKAAEMGISVSTIGMGLPEGGPIPMYRGGTLMGFKKDQAGNTVVTRLNEVMLQQIAAAGNGIYVRASNAESGLDKVLERLGKIEKTTFDSKVFSDYESRFQYLIAFALALLLIDILLAERRSKWFDKFRVFKVNMFNPRNS